MSPSCLICLIFRSPDQTIPFQEIFLVTSCRAPELSSHTDLLMPASQQASSPFHVSFPYNTSSNSGVQ